MAIGNLLRRLAARRVGHAEMDAHGADVGHRLLAEEGLRRGQPDELDAFLLGVLHLALGARHVGAVAAIEALHRLRALAHRRPHAIHRRVAAADHHDVLAFRVQHAGFELGDDVAQTLPVGGREIVERRRDAGQADAGCCDVARLVDAGGDEDGGMTRAQLLEHDVAADVAVQVEGDLRVAQQRLAALHDLFLELEVRDAIDQQPADPVVAIVDRDLVALAAKLLGRRETGRAGADDADAFGPLAARPDRLHPAALPGGVGDVLLDRADRDRFESLLDDAVALAETVLRADATADLREVVGRGGEFVGLLEPALGGELQPVGDVVVQRTMDLTEGHAALRTARRLLGRLVLGESFIDLVEVAAPFGCRPLVGHGLRRSDELQHPLGHPRPPRTNCEILLRKKRADRAFAAFFECLNHFAKR